MSKPTTVEKNNRFYEQPDGEILTENEQLKEWLVIANESNDYFREENVRLINREKELLREIHNKINEIKRLNNNWNELERYINEEYIYDELGMKIFDASILQDKLQELKGNDSNEIHS